MQIEYPAVFDPFFRDPKRYNIAEGGRGRGASWTIGRKLLIESAFWKHRNLCTREYQNSIRDSVHRVLVDQISQLKLEPYYEIYKDAIYSKCGSEFIFKGLHTAIQEIKSIEGITRCWVEEAEGVTEYSWTVLIPTIRAAGSQFYISYNPEDEESATYRRFSLNPPPDSNVIRSTYLDNPWFPEVLKKEMEYCRSVDYEAYEHIWLGKIKKYADALVLRGKFKVEEFETPADARLFFGSDFGYSSAPTTIVRCFIKDRKLFIDYDGGGVGIEINETPALYDSIPGIRNWRITADSARPETISYLQQQGFDIVGAEKGKGSVEDGIQFLRSFEEIIIHPRCKGTFRDCQNYKWKVDRITGDILPIPVDAHNDYIDAIRYAIEKYIKRKVTIWDLV